MRAERLPGCAAPAIVLALALIQLAAFRWGVVTPDTVWQYKQALAGAYDDWHPAVMAALWRQLGAARFGGAPLLLFDLALYWGGVLALAEAARRDRRPWATAGILALAALPIPFGQLGALLKDSLLAAAALGATGLLALRERRDRWLLAVGAAVLLVLASAARINAMFATAPLFALLLPVAWRRGWRWYAAVAAGGVVALAGAWTIDQALLRPVHSRPVMGLVNFDFGGIVTQGGGSPYPNISSGIAEEATAACYDPRLYNPTNLPACDKVEEDLVGWLDAHHVSPSQAWLGAIAGSPVAWAQHRLAHLNRNWRFAIRDVPADAVYLMSEPNDLGLHFTANGLTKVIVRAAQWLAWTPVGRPVTWVAMAVGLLVAGIGRRSALGKALAWSAILYASGYAVVSVSHDLRYNLWTLLAVGTAMCTVSRDFAWRKALVLPVIAMAIETVALF